jgi:hypothetical protein
VDHQSVGFVTPAHAGVQERLIKRIWCWMPAFAGMTVVVVVEERLIGHR